ncbi:MAG: Spy/CpxP family protein refolding chaperone [Ramlibacter sp.]|nr:Spy/CpxP family protein refolding chaperone [Ramlibacter sp.]
MKFAHKHWLVGAMLTALVAVAGAQSPAPATTGAPTAAAGEGHGRHDPAMKQERIAKRLDTLKQKLQLASGQESAWSTYAAALKPMRGPRPDRAELARLATPERIDRMRALRTERMADMDRRGQATKTFYAALSTDQKKVFDDETAPRAHLGHGGRHHKG